MCVVYTRWGFSAVDKKRRAKARLTEEGRRNEVLDWLNKEYPSSRGKAIDVYFTDTFGMESDKSDETSNTLREIWTVAAAKEDFICK